MDVAQILDLSNNILSLLLLMITGAAGIFIFFSDPLRRWRFFGYLPTVIVALVDPLRHKIMVVQFDTKYYGHKIPLQLPQGGIYSNHVGEAVVEVLEKELGLTPNLFDIKHVRELGELNIQRHHERMKKYQYGVVGISPLILGKGYVGCLSVCDSRQVLKKMSRGVGIESAKFIDFEEFKKSQKLCDDSYDAKRILYNKLFAVVENYLKGKN